MKFILLLTLILSAQAYAQDDNKNQRGSEHQESHGHEGGMHGGGGHGHKGGDHGHEGGKHGGGHEDGKKGCCDQEHEGGMHGGGHGQEGGMHGNGDHER